MYYFIETEKAKVLQGRTIKYLAEKKLFITSSYLSQILSGKRACSRLLASNIAQCISWDSKVEDYFVQKGE